MWCYLFNVDSFNLDGVGNGCDWKYQLSRHKTSRSEISHILEGARSAFTVFHSPWNLAGVSEAL